MSQSLCLFIVLLDVHKLASSFPLSSYTPLQGRHLIIGLQSFPLVIYTTRNASGQIVKAEGVGYQMLDWLSQRYNFKYSYLQVNDTRLEKENEALPGLTYYLLQGKCDVIVGAVTIALSRHASMDFAQGFMHTPVAILIPMPEPSNNVASVIKPFQITVWIILLVMIPVTAVAIYSVVQIDQWQTLLHFDGDRKQSDARVISQKFSSPSIEVVILDVFRVILNQGGNFERIGLVARIVVAAWCIAGLILVCAYNSLLISYVMASNAVPVVNSLTDLASNPNIQPVIDKGWGVDIYLSGAVDGIFKQMSDRIRSYPKSRCTSSQGCVDLVKSGSHAYLSNYILALNIISEDYKTSRKCRLALAKHMEYAPPSSWSFPKRSSYTEYFARGFLELDANGLINLWIGWSQKDATHCRNEADRIQRFQISGSKSRLTLQNLTGAFAILIIGWVFSFFAFVTEKLLGRNFCKASKTQLNFK